MVIEMMGFDSNLVNSIGKLTKGHFKIQFFRFIRTGIVVSFILALGFGYVFIYPKFQQEVNHIDESLQPNLPVGACNIYEGKWVRDESYPLYNASQCAFIERGFDCISNGRRDKLYMKWRWKPRDCDIPRFSASKILEALRGKRIVFVGDSLSRQQWESMICFLMNGVDDKKSVYEVNGNKITKRIRYLGVRFSRFDLTVDFYRSVYLVRSSPVPSRSPKRVKATIMVDKLDDVNGEWVDADALIFNSGHWWTPTKLFEIGRYFQTDGSLKLGLPVMSAFRLALTTWASWAEANVDTNRTRVFFRTFEPSHWSGWKHKSCKVTRTPSLRTNGKDRSEISDIIKDIVGKMSVPVTILDMTRMGAFRSDAHVGSWSDRPSVPDCSHWCLPGLPDTWNEILFFHLLPQP